MDNLKEEQQYRELKKLAQELHIPIPEAFIELEVRDKDGMVIQRHRQRSHSWTRNAYNVMFSALALKDGTDSTFGAGKLNIKNQAGEIRYGNLCFAGVGRGTAEGTAGGYRAPAANNSYGILVGSGTNAEGFEDYALQTKIAHGTGAGQLSYQESEPHSKTYADTTMKNTLIRYFNNNSGGDVAVNEVGLVAYCLIENTLNSPMVSRDKLTTTVTVPNTGQLKVTYTIQLTYPA